MFNWFVIIFDFRMLPGEDLLNVACVNKMWFNICKGDCKLRQKIRRYLRQKRKTEIANRLFGASRRNSRRNVAIRPAMTNVLNAADARNVREISKYDYYTVNLWLDAYFTYCTNKSQTTNYLHFLKLHLYCHTKIYFH